MIVSLIVAIAENYAIGKDNDLLWHLPKDMAFFKETTTGHHIITGRKSYLSIPEKFRPLQGRTNIIVSRNPSFNIYGALVKTSIEEAIAYAKEHGETEVFIIGGGEIYRQALPLADKLYITEVHATFEDAHVFFPEFNKTEWKETSREKHPADDKHQYAFDIVVYEKA